MTAGIADFKVLIVDDQPANRKLLANNIQYLGFDALVASNGAEALAIIEAEAVDVILLDIMMPGMSGYEVLRQLKNHELHREIPVIVISALDQVESIVQCLELGAVDYLTKPYNRKILAARVEAELMKKRLNDFENLRHQQIEEELQAAKSQIFHANQMEVLGQMAGSIAHDVNSKLSAIHNYLQILETMKEEHSEQTSKTHEKMSRAVKKSTDLLSKLINFGRKNETIFGTVNIHDPIQGALDLAEHKLSTEGIKLIFEPWPDSLEVVGDANQLDQVFMNLFLNAGDSMPDGGELRVKTQLITDLVGTPQVEISVTDTGCGISPEILEKIFIPFFTTKPPGKGTGLGMFIIKSIVEAHQGTLALNSEVGKGTTFTITLPAA